MKDDWLTKAELAAAGKFAENAQEAAEDKPFLIINRLRQSFQQVTANELVQPGDQWGHLIIKELMGQGGMGLVFAAHDTLLDRPVAVKFLNASHSGLLSSDQFTQEARHMAKIRHPNVLAVYGANTFDEITGFWSELLIGETLDQAEATIFSWPDILSIALQLAEAVVNIHAAGLVHGDIKPQNIILEPNRGAVLMDFGSVLDLNSDSQDWQSSTPLVMAPELFLGHQKSTSSDVYALGVVFYYISHLKQFPHITDNLPDLKKAVHSDIAYPATIGPKSWVKLLQQMLDKNPKNRPSMVAVSEQLTSIKKAPAIKKKRMFWGSLAVLLLAFTVYLQVNNQRLSQANTETQNALNQSTQLNQLLQNMLGSVSTINFGKDLLMFEAINQFFNGINTSHQISDDVKAKALITLSSSLISLGKYESGLATIHQARSLEKLTAPVALEVDIFLVSKYLHDIYLNQERIEMAQNMLLEIEQSPSLLQLTNPALSKWHHAKMMLAKVNNEFQEAMEQGDQAIRLLKLEPPTLSNWRELGILYDLKAQIQGIQGLHLESESNYLKAMEYYAKVNAQPNSNTLGTRANLAVTYAQTGQINKSLEQMAIIKTEAKIFFGENHPRYFAHINNYAAALADDNQPQKSLELLEEHHTELINSLGQGTITQLYYEGLMANNLKSLKRFHEAQDLYEKLITDINGQLGNQHPLWFINQINLNELYLETNREELAIENLEKLLPQLSELFGNDSDLTRYAIDLFEQASDTSK